MVSSAEARSEGLPDTTVVDMTRPLVPTTASMTTLPATKPSTASGGAMAGAEVRSLGGTTYCPFEGARVEEIFSGEVRGACFATVTTATCFFAGSGGGIGAAGSTGGTCGAEESLDAEGVCGEGTNGVV